MSFEMKKTELLSELLMVKDLLPVNDGERLSVQLEELINDITNDFNTVVVVGEFKNGKSTFINSFLSESLLPVDVTPTTATINALMWAEEKGLHVHKSDESVEKLPLTKETLEDYVADKDFNPDSIDYLKVLLPNRELRERNIVLVDTPGVNDLNRHRSEITYRFIPKADVVLFMLDLTTPVRLTEKRFIEDALLKEGLHRIIYLANFIDQVDDDEVEATLEFTRNRLMEIVGDKVKLYPLSAQTAIDAIEDGDRELLKWSGLPRIKSAIREEIASGDQTGARLNRYRFRADKIYRAIEKDIDQKKALSKQSLDELNRDLVFIQETFAEKEENVYKINDYVTDRENEFLFMIHKSLDTFSRNVKEDMIESITMYKSADIKDFIEEQLPLYLKKQYKRWIEEHLERIHGLLYKLERALSVGLAKEFNTKVQLHVKQHQIVKMQGDHLDITIDDISNTGILAGLIAGGAGALMMIVGGPVLLPLIGFAGYPILQKKLVEKRLDHAKQILLNEIGPALDQSLTSFRNEMDRYVKEYVSHIQQEALRMYEEQLRILEDNIEDAIKERKDTKAGLQETIDELEEVMKHIRQMTGNTLVATGGER